MCRIERCEIRREHRRQRRTRRADALGDRLDCLVFVDAVVPPTEGTHVTSPGLRKLLDDRVEDGVLLNWFDWWPRGTIVEMVGDEAVVVMMRGEAPRTKGVTSGSMSMTGRPSPSLGTRVAMVLSSSGPDVPGPCQVRSGSRRTRRPESACALG